MCELLALSANTPTDISFSFRGLTRRGGVTDTHSDGWGLASFDPNGAGVNIYKEQNAAAFSPVAAELADLDLKFLYSLAHIRKATQGVVVLENCHPFHRTWRKEDWVFAHNGDLKCDFLLRKDYQPVGNTDSEAAFCWILNVLSARAPEHADGHGLFPILNDCAAWLASNGIFNCLISNGRWLYVFCDTRLHIITRRAPFTAATLLDEDHTIDFSTVTTNRDVVTIVSTEPLTTNERWRSLEIGEALLLQCGEVIQRRLGLKASYSV